MERTWVLEEDLTVKSVEEAWFSYLGNNALKPQLKLAGAERKEVNSLISWYDLITERVGDGEGNSN